MVETSSKARELMEAALKNLGYSTQKELYVPTQDPSTVEISEWLDKGEWLSLAQQVGAERVFFIDSNPVVVFAQHSGSSDESLRAFFNRVWCMSRPRLLFLAHDGELAVYDLGKEPVAYGQNFEQQLLAKARTAAEVSSELARFRREQIEDGRVFADSDLSARNRADEALIRHLKWVSQQLTGEAQDVKVSALKPEHAHALIGRSIFVRYLEDREILVRKDFEELAQNNPEWLELLNRDEPQPLLEPGMSDKLYLKVLQSKEFTYKLFQYLSDKFHGDIFPSEETEEEVVQLEHLDLLRRFLSGQDGQGNLFFWAYDFSIVPIELISSIYEEFYHAESEAAKKEEDGEKKKKTTDAGSHYTPSALVEWVLSQTLTEDVLAQSPPPRIIDPAAGSGIFLVESFRRIVRYNRFQATQSGGEVSRDDMLDILRQQIAGIELNPHAARVAAFSLYLAFLHFQKPPAIRKNPRLPHLLYDERRSATEDDYDVLLVANSFDIGAAVSDPDVRLRFESACADVVVGNPPWGLSGQGAKLVAVVAKKWCEARNLPVGDGEPSQQFLHRAADLLREGGRCGFLVSNGVLLKQKKTSVAFRQHWLQNVTLHQVTNFTHVRHVFFKGAISPFLSIIWTKGRKNCGNLVHYWSAKETVLVEENEIVVLSRADLRVIPQSELISDGRLWKVYWWGGHHDAALLSSLRLHPDLASYKSLWAGEPGTGFKENDKRKKSKPSWTKQLKELPVEEFGRYGAVSPDQQLVLPPEEMALCRQERLFENLRLLIKGAPSRDKENFYKIIARLEDRDYCMRHSIYSFPVQDSPENRVRAKVVLAILWSSLTLYYLFLSEGRFGIWFEQVNQQEFKQIPVCFPDSSAQGTALQQRIVSIVDRLEQSPEEQSKEQLGLFQEEASERSALEKELDETIFELYRLSPDERDLVRDMCEVGFDLLSNGSQSAALQPLARMGTKPSSGFIEDLDADAGRAELDGYLRAFVGFWNTQFKANERVEFGWRILNSPNGGEDNIMLGVHFGACYSAQRAEWNQQPSSSWDEVLHSFAESNRVPLGTRAIEIEGLTRMVSKSDVLIVKRNERRLWTPSAAREDAEAALLQLWQQPKEAELVAA